MKTDREPQWSCPNCGPDEDGNVDGGPVDIQGSEAIQECFCHTCEHEWINVYRFASSHSAIKDKSGSHVRYEQDDALTLSPGNNADNRHHLAEARVWEWDVDDIVKYSVASMVDFYERFDGEFLQDWEDYLPGEELKTNNMAERIPSGTEE